MAKSTRILCVVAFAAVYASCGNPASEMHSHPADALLGVYLAQSVPAPGYSPRLVIGDSTTVYVAPEPFLTDQDVDSMRAVLKPHGMHLAIWFSPRALAKLHEVTAENIGKMVVLAIHSEVISASKILVASSPDAVVSAGGDMAPGKAKQLVSAINHVARR